MEIKFEKWQIINKVQNPIIGDREYIVYESNKYWKVWMYDLLKSSNSMFNHHVIQKNDGLTLKDKNW